VGDVAELTEAEILKARAIWHREPDISDQERAFVANILRRIADSMSEADWFRFNAEYAAGKLNSDTNSDDNLQG